MFLDIFIFKINKPICKRDEIICNMVFIFLLGHLFVL